MMRRILRNSVCLGALFLAGTTLIAPPPSVHAYTSAEEEEIVDFIIGNTFYVLLHEFGHALVSEMNIPVLGKEEDAVDTLATVLMLSDEPDPEVDQMLIDAMDGWFMSEDRSQQLGYEPALFGEHSLDAQRAYRIGCLAYGSDPYGFEELADSIELPADRRDTCIADWEQADQSWSSVLAPHLREDHEPRPTVTVRHGQASGALAEYAALMTQSEMLPTFATELVSLFRFPQPITLVSAECGVENAFWDPETKEIVMCYELMAYFASLIIEDIELR